MMDTGAQGGGGDSGICLSCITTSTDQSRTGASLQCRIILRRQGGGLRLTTKRPSRRGPGGKSKGIRDGLCSSDGRELQERKQFAKKALLHLPEGSEQRKVRRRRASGSKEEGEKVRQESRTMSCKPTRLSKPRNCRKDKKRGKKGAKVRFFCFTYEKEESKSGGGQKWRR